MPEGGPEAIDGGASAAVPQSAPVPLPETAAAPPSKPAADAPAAAPEAQAGPAPAAAPLLTVKPSTVALLAPLLAPDVAAIGPGAGKNTLLIPPGKLGPLDPQPIAEPRIAVAESPAGASAATAWVAAPALPATTAAAVAAPPPAAGQDAPLFAGDAAVREAQLYLQQLGYYRGPLDGVMSWPTVEALVAFDASGAGPKAVIADASRPDSTWLARLRIAAAAKQQ
jgi:hypothetical protein